MKIKKPTPAQRRALENLAAGRRADAHCRTRSDHGGMSATLVCLHKAGWMDHDGITEAGRSAISKAAPTGEKIGGQRVWAAMEVQE